MRMIYIIPNHDMGNKCCGVTKKIMSQKEAFFNLDINGEMLYFIDKTLYIEDFSEKCNKIVSDKVIRKSKYDELIKIINKKYDNDDEITVYIRYPRSDYRFLKFLKLLKQRKNIKIILEIVTYPYDKEDIYFILKYKVPLKAKISYSIKILNDRIYRRILNKYVDKVVTFSEDLKIFKIDTIKTSNGIDKSMITFNKSDKKSDTNVNLIGVGGIAKHHGFDRIITGMAEYNINNEEKVYFHIVGDGIEIDNLKTITKQTGQEKYVKFYGYKTGQELEEIYNLADIAIGSIGRHRNNIYQLADLKSREYCAKGIPFIKTVKDLDFEDFKYVLTIDANDKPVDIKKILRFYNDIKKDKDYKNNMKKFAMNNLTWESKFLPIVKYFNDK